MNVIRENVVLSVPAFSADIHPQTISHLDHGVLFSLIHSIPYFAIHFIFTDNNLSWGDKLGFYQ